MMKVSRTEVKNSLKEAINQAVEGLGGFKSFVRKGEVVLLKPNFNTADPFPASTDPEFLQAVVELTYEAGAKMVMIGESSTMSLNTRKIMEDLGIFKLQEIKTPPRIYVFEEGEWRKKEIPAGKYLKKVSLPVILDRADKLIFLPCLKTHSQAQFTGSLKLAIGFVRPFERLPIHLKNLQEKIADLSTIIRPDLIIMDGRKCFINQGPTKGELKEPNLILASTDRVALDIEGVKIIQSFPGNSLARIKPEELPQIKAAREAGL